MKMYGMEKWDDNLVGFGLRFYSVDSFLILGRLFQFSNKILCIKGFCNGN